MAEAATAAGGNWTVWNQFGVQALAVGVAIVFAGLMTFIILYTLDKLMKIKINRG